MLGRPDSSGRGPRRASQRRRPEAAALRCLQPCLSTVREWAPAASLSLDKEEDGDEHSDATRDSDVDAHASHLDAESAVEVMMQGAARARGTACPLAFPPAMPGRPC